MSRRRELARRLAALTEIADILGAMKSLALMESRALLGFIACQERMVAGIEAAMAEFLAWHPDLVHPWAQTAEDQAGTRSGPALMTPQREQPWPSARPVRGQTPRLPARPVAGEALWPPATGMRPPAAALWVLVGSEQGFCGEFNARIAARAQDPAGPPLAGRWLVVGQRLATRLGEDPRILRRLPGATLADEVPAVLLQLTREINLLLATGEPAGAGLGVLYQEEATNAPCLRQLLPLGGSLAPPGARGMVPSQAIDPLPPAAADPLPPGASDPLSPAATTPIPLALTDPLPARRLGRSHIHPFPPAIHLSPGELLGGLSRHYLYAVLNQVLYSSLTAENRQRQAHMDQALQRLEAKTEGLRRACNAQRQEEITEEIEILLLSADQIH